MCVDADWWDPGWADRVVARMATKAPRSPVTPFPCQGELWVHKTCGRRGKVAWVSKGRVRLVFDDGTAGVEHCTLDFLRLYRPV